MIKVNGHVLKSMERNYGGIVGSIMEIERSLLPRCPLCGSKDTANVYVGTTQRAKQVAMATSKAHLVASNPAPGRYFCNACTQYFGWRTRSIIP